MFELEAMYNWEISSKSAEDGGLSGFLQKNIVHGTHQAVC